MKIFTLGLIIFSWSIPISTCHCAEDLNEGRSNAFKITYPEQTIHVYFNYLPDHGLSNILTEYDLSERKKIEIVKILKHQLDDLPMSFVHEYLDIDIFPLYIKNSTEYGFAIKDQIVIDASKVKYEMSYSNSIKSSFLHEIAHFIEDQSRFRRSTATVRNFLNDKHRSLSRKKENYGSDVYQSGYVSRYANGELLHAYDASEEFAELFAHLICEDNRAELLKFTENYPGTPLADKVNIMLNYLDENIPDLGRSYVFNEKQAVMSEPVEIDKEDEEFLLNAHEYKSNESMDFSSFSDVEEQTDLWQDVDRVGNDNLDSEFESVDDEFEYMVYRNYHGPYDNTPSSSTDEKKKKKKKRRKGRGLLIAGTAIYVALQLMK